MVVSSKGYCSIYTTWQLQICKSGIWEMRRNVEDVNYKTRQAILLLAVAIVNDGVLSNISTERYKPGVENRRTRRSICMCDCFARHGL